MSKNHSIQATESQHNAVQELARKANEKELLWLKYVIALGAGIFPLVIQVFDWETRKTAGTPLLTFGRFMILIFIFQLLIVLLLSFLRGRNRKQIDLRQHIVASYLLAIEQSTLNPNPQKKVLLSDKPTFQ